MLAALKWDFRLVTPQQGWLQPRGREFSRGLLPEGASPGPAFKPALTERVSPYQKRRAYGGLVPKGLLRARQVALTVVVTPLPCPVGPKTKSLGMISVELNLSAVLQLDKPVVCLCAGFCANSSSLNTVDFAPSYTPGLWSAQFSGEDPPNPVGFLQVCVCVCLCVCVLCWHRTTPHVVIAWQ